MVGKSTLKLPVKCVRVLCLLDLITGTGHLKRRQKSCKQKTDQRSRVQSRLAYNSDDSVHNWDYKPDVARSELCRLIYH